MSSIPILFFLGVFHNQYTVYKATLLLYCHLYATHLYDKLYIQLMIVQLAA
jgi:hypothetical protein